MAISKATGLFYMNPRAVLFSNLNAKQMAAFIPKKCIWKNIIQSWCKLRRNHQIVRTRPVKTYEEVMAQPMWFNPEIIITAFKASNTWKSVEKHKPIKRWEPLAIMQFHTLRDLWNDQINDWQTLDCILRFVPQYYKDEDTTEELYEQIGKLREELVRAIPR